MDISDVGKYASRLLSRSYGSMMRGVAAFGNPLFLFFLALAPAAWLLPEPSLTISWTSLVAMAVIEEILFRGLIQDLFARMLPWGSMLPGISPANASASVIFSLVHLFHHPPLWAALVFFPSLVFGWSKDRFKSLLPCIALHLTYNLLFFSRP